MKSLLLLFLPLLFVQAAFAQRDNLNFRVQIGRTLPQGNFAGKESLQIDGYAENGIVGNFGVGIPVAKNIQLDFDYSRAVYRVDIIELRNSYFSQVILPIKSQSNAEEISGAISADKYTNTNLFFSLKLGAGDDQFRAYLKPGIGVGWFGYPVISEEIRLDNEYVLSTTTSESEHELTFNLTGGVEFKIAENISFDFNVQYIKTEYRVVADIIAENEKGESFTATDSQNVEFKTINLNLGILFYINSSSTD